MNAKIRYLYAAREELIKLGVDSTTIFTDLCATNDLAQAELTDEQCAKLIPEGEYCYNPTSHKVCPFWDIMNNLPNQNNGYCHYMAQGDWQGEGFGLIWDQCKECGVNNNED